MRFWDSSALVALLMDERPTVALRGILEDDADQTVWCLTAVEIGSALARRTREGLAASRETTFRTEWKELSDYWREIGALEPVRARALRLLNTHSLRAGDALQLAAALVACDDRPDGLPFVCLDDRLRDAARREGFPVLP
jgi:predicted nucleic acid-binding protein